MHGAVQDPSCVDGAINGSETDIDCGGSCDACALGKVCENTNDCGEGFCIDTASASYTTTLAGTLTLELDYVATGCSQDNWLKVLTDTDDDVFRAAEELGIDLSRREPSSVEEV